MWRRIARIARFAVARNQPQQLPVSVRSAPKVRLNRQRPRSGLRLGLVTKFHTGPYAKARQAILLLAAPCLPPIMTDLERRENLRHGRRRLFSVSERVLIIAPYRRRRDISRCPTRPKVGMKCQPRRKRQCQKILF